MIRRNVAAPLFRIDALSLVLNNNTYVSQGPWLQALSIMTPRYLKLTGQMDF